MIKKNENWVREETLAFIKNNAENEKLKRKKREDDLKKQGYKKIMVDHPTEPRCKIEKWVKNIKNE